MSNTQRPANKLTVVEEGTEFKGILTSSCPIDVRGRVEGELKTPALTIGASGAVHGRATVGTVHSQGEISGEFEADKVQLSGVVRDNTVIRARSLDVKLCAERGKLEIVFGECELSVGDEPTESDHLAKPEAAVAAPELPAPLPAPEGMPAAPLPASVEAALLAIAVPVAEAAPFAEAVPVAANPAAEAHDDEAEDGADADGGKRKRRRKNGQEEPATGWSQPPPAS